MYILTYAGNCGSCSQIAQTVHRESGGKIIVKSLSSIRKEFSAEIDESKPTLLYVVDQRINKIYTGSKMSIKMMQLLGPQKSAKILSGISSELRGTGINRRSTLAGISATIGLILTGNSFTIATATTDTSKVSAVDQQKIYKEIIELEKFKIAQSVAEKDGFSTRASEYAIIRQDNEYLFFYFMEHQKKPRTDAAIISCLITPKGYDFSIEYVSGTIDALTSSSSVGNALNFSLPTNYASLPMGPVEYFGCISSCVGASCGVQAIRCRYLIHMAAILACMTAICGSKVRTCHNVCRKAW